MSADTENTTTIRFRNHLLPGLGALIPGSKNLLSPFSLQFDQKASQAEIEASGVLDSAGKLAPKYQPLLAVLANPASLVDLRFLSGGHFKQFSLYYGKPDTAPVLLLNAGDDLLLEYPADLKAITNGLIQFCSDSVVASFDFDVSLGYSASVALTALIDLHRRAVARAFADLSPVETISIGAETIHKWISGCPENPQWLTFLLTRAGDKKLQLETVQKDLDALVGLGVCQASAEGYALAGSAWELGNRIVLIDSLYFVDIARVDAEGQVGIASLAAVQAGVNDLLQVDFQEDEIAFKSLAPLEFILQIEHFLEKGGSELSWPVEASDSEISSACWGLIVLGMESTFELSETTLIGRADDCDLRLAGDQISRHHARIERRQEIFWITDLNSSNGVLVNRSRITEPVCLAAGDQIQIGDTPMEVTVN